MKMLCKIQYQRIHIMKHATYFVVNMKNWCIIIVAMLLLFFAIGCVSEDTSTNQEETVQETDDNDVPKSSSLNENEETTNNVTIVQETKDILKSNGYEANVTIEEETMNVNFDASTFTKTDLKSMTHKCLNIMTDHLPNQRVHVLFYDDNVQKIAFGRYTEHNDETTISIYEYTKYPQVEKTTERMFDSYEFDADVELSQRGMLVYLHTKGVSDSDLRKISENCVKVMVKEIPEQNARVFIYNDADQMIADGYYIDWLDKIDIVVY